MDCVTSEEGSKAWAEVVDEKLWLKSTKIDLGEHEGFVKWVLGTGTVKLPKSLANREYVNGTSEYNIYTGEDDWGSEDDGEEEEEEEIEDFEELVKEIDTLFKEYEGAIFPMSNIKAPRDAGWAIVNGEVLQCQNTTEVCLLLKSSSLTTEDWSARHTASKPLQMTLRKWYDIDEYNCFRCFVVNGVLVGISQKRLSEFFPFLYNVIDNIKEAAVALASSVTASLSSHDVSTPEKFCFDMYVLKNKSKGRLMGFHPFTAESALLFTPEDLLSIPPQDCPELRIIPDRDSIVDVGVANSMKQAIPEDLKNFSLLNEAAESIDKQNGKGEVKASVEEMIKLMKMQDDQ
eukprot:TRINITY_DN875_c9_g1_i1.p1 TRINITY_DN875_c9_g1~~TRINITY_DN875_c9_g1_i1.p1  ORF type:complete len:346 (+),score=100.53 TRINITY_DN875_c9_g1_i1:48-1085(+)